jgi:hydrogenase maturation protease
MKTLVLGIGNDILGDDGVGLHIAREVAHRVRNGSIEVKETTAAGLNLLEMVRGYQRLIVTDAILMDSTDSGKIHRLTLKALGESRQLTPHGAGLPAMLEVGKQLYPGEMPEDVVIYAVETANVDYVTDEMTRSVSEAVPRAAQLILDDLKAS